MSVMAQLGSEATMRFLPFLDHRAQVEGGERVHATSTVRAPGSALLTSVPAPLRPLIRALNHPSLGES